MVIGPATPLGDQQAVNAARMASAKDVAVFVVPRFFRWVSGWTRFRPTGFAAIPWFACNARFIPMSHPLKRLFDIAVSAGVLVATAPICFVAAVAVKLNSPGPIHFGQVRIGEHAKRSLFIYINI